MKLLVIATTLFVDPHGSSDEGSIEKFITSDKKYLKMHGHIFDNDDKVIDEDDLQGSEDGYNSTYVSYLVKIISDEKAKEFSDIIKKYNKINVKEKDSKIIDISNDPEFNEDIDED